MNNSTIFGNFSSLLCTNLEYNGLFIFNTILLLLFSSLACCFSVVVFRLIWRHMLFHANVRLILLHFSAANALSSLFAMFRVAYNFCLIFFGFQRFVTTRFICVLIDSLNIVPMVVACVSIGGVGFERCVATVRKNVSDPDKSGYVVRIVFCSLWVFSVINAAGVILDAQQFGDQQVCYCALTLAGSQIFIFSSLPVYICFEISYLLCYLYVYKENKKDLHWSINTAKHGLHERYQKWSNIYLSRSLLPNVISNSVLYILVGCSYYIIHPLYWREQNIYSVNVWSMIFILISFVAFLQPLLFVLCNEKMKKSILNKENSIFNSFSRRKYSTIRTKTQKDDDELGSASKRDKTIISYQVKPEESQLILDNIWEKHSSR